MKIGNMNSLPWYVRLGIFSALALVVYGVFWYFVTRGTRKDTRALQDQISVLQKANAEAQIASQRLSEFRAAYKNKQEELEELKALLPEQRELTKVLEGIQDRAKSTGLSLRKFSPKEDMQQDFYSGKKIDVSVQSSFAGFLFFFEQMPNYQRIFSIRIFEIKQLENQSTAKPVEARFDLTEYYASSKNLQKKNENKPKKTPASSSAENPA